MSQMWIVVPCILVRSRMVEASKCRLWCQCLEFSLLLWHCWFRGGKGIWLVRKVLKVFSEILFWRDSRKVLLKTGSTSNRDDSSSNSSSWVDNNLRVCCVIGSDYSVRIFNDSISSACNCSHLVFYAIYVYGPISVGVIHQVMKWNLDVSDNTEIKCW